LKHLFISNRQRAVPVNTGFLRRLTRSLLRDLLDEKSFDLGVYLVDAVQMTRLNETFLRHKGSTDVITFDYAGKAGRAARPSGPSAPRDEPDAGPALFGEIFICADEAVVQARRFRTSWQSELARYVIHGVLHLRGFEDRRPADRRKMKLVENRLLKEIARRFPLRKDLHRPKLTA
jgi:probable rRNA maturation factor